MTAARADIVPPQKYCEAYEPTVGATPFAVPNSTTVEQCDAMARSGHLKSSHVRSAPMCLGKDMVLRAGTQGNPGTPPVPDECAWR